jgi:hypothetical protein
MTVEDLIERLRKLPKNAMVITFDDCGPTAVEYVGIADGSCAEDIRNRVFGANNKPLIVIR